MAGLTLVLGGIRSGKSRLAERLARARGGAAVVYVATATAGDAEMVARIAHHRARRPAGWRTVEAPTGVAAALAALEPPPAVVLLEDLGLLLSNLLLTPAGDARPAEEAEAALAAEITVLLAWRAAAGADLIVVSNEVGLAPVPLTPLGRVFADLLGRANQRLAAAADAAYLVVAGVPLDLFRLRAALPGAGDDCAEP
ncbi:MAG: bifunctional adenosylcobinamide kinase/adenosylcobinamide-phosphate guanylyltransferase [Chloroflexi bacterium]|nr:bifunctional adenosylcobinamide kinase/adenosylcobinamide-phosphate guanylyltransferase [Chloroflexota bacterium]